MPISLFHQSYLVLVLLLISTNFVLIPVNLQMLMYTLTILYIGSTLSLKLLEKDGEGRRKHGDAEQVTQRDALMFPVFGSIALCSLYLAFKLFGPEVVNKLLTVYMSAIGVAAFVQTTKPVTGGGGAGVMGRAVRINFTLPSPLGPLARYLVKDDKVDVTLSSLDLGLGAVGAVAAGAFLYFKHFTLHNLFAICFCVQALHYVSLSTFKVAFLLLGGLFFYDVFWVFGTDVMVTVAKNFEGPVKIIFPTSLHPLKTSILGLGDVVLPGMLIAMCLRYDCHRAGAEPFGPFPRPYFWTVLGAYALGLVITEFVMVYFNAAQPALLYLVPCTVGAVLGRALVQGEMGRLWAYSEEQGAVGENKGKDE
jgi:minor histocompatibility antigen H13